ncbi:MAG: histidine kinase dimerization/phosphoacceptor domain -containing protein [Euryarchaeota archaeon]|nr:histidine kinase dimerization/phosphoacceptor domain -containing protein [Euryarchaeota archaeon]
MNFMHATRIKVLLVEDNSGDARLIQEMLSEAGDSVFALEQADRLSTGLERLAAADINAVLLDLGLPDSSGLDTFITVHAQVPDVPIVMLTGLDDAELAIAAVQEGAQDYLPKNKLDSELLVRTIRYAIERKKTGTHIKHLNSVLKAIRGVNQLIVMEKDRDTMLQNACDTLAEAWGYDAAWLGFLEDGEAFATVKGSGFREDVTRFCEHVLGGDHPPCIKNALAQKDSFVVLDKTRECGDCVFKDACVGKEAAIIRVEHAGKFFGLLAVLLAPDVAVDEEEKGLLEEVAGDIAFGLHDMELEVVRKQAEEQLKASLKEKEVLLLEIHHRVKNNLQVISSLLNLQARAAKDANTSAVLLESRDRINTMALIHTKLYESGNLSEINMKGFVDGLIRQLFMGYRVRDTKITPAVHVVDFTLPISIAVPFGLVVNELLTNAFKHAFVNRAEGKIEVSLSAPEEGAVCLTVSDDGVGLPEGFDFNTTKTLGLHLVKILVEDQLRGKLEIISEKGTTFTIAFEVEE